MTHLVPRFALLALSVFPLKAWADDCSSFSGKALDKIACADPTAARFLNRLAKAQKALEKAAPAGARIALRSHQSRWELFADAWLAANSPADPKSSAAAPRCSSPRALLFQRMDSLEKAVLTLKENKPKTLDLCYDNAACLEPGATNTEMVCETVYMGVEGVPANAEPIVITLLGEWVAKGHTFETHVTKSLRNSEPCELVSEKTMVEYLRGGFVTMRTRQGDTCNPLAANEMIQTFDLRSARALKISDFTTSPAALLALLKKRKEGDVLQALLRHQLNGETTRPNIEPGECAELPFTTLNDVNIHVTSDGLRINKLFKKAPPELAPCQFKVEEGLSPGTMALLLKGRKSPASGMLRYIR
ncbi:MAG: DUF1311 domain-containing protein [Betaproteobacteria bacterium]|nr:DUF1311 domain-containing protein [Betaproteobacteria bacterium]